MFFRRRKKHPLFAVPVSPRRRKIKINWRAGLWGLGAVLFLGGLAYLLIFSPALKIKAWSVVSSNFTSQAQAQEMVSGYFGNKFLNFIPGDNWLTFSAGNLTSRIMAEFPEAAAVKIDKNILKGIKITIKGRQPAAFWCRAVAPIVMADQATTTKNNVLPQSDNCFFVDDDGLLFREAPSISGTALPTFFSQAGTELNLGEKATASSTIQIAAQLKKQLRDIDMEIVGVMTGADGSQEMTVFSEAGWQSYFDLGRPVQSQVKILSALLADELKDKTATLKYIDLRVAGKVYYR